MTDSGPHRRVVLAGVVLALALSAVVGFLVGADVTGRRHDLGGWHSATGHVGTKVVSIEYDGWVYGARDSVEAWIDRGGAWHDSGWPDCLRPPPGAALSARDVPVRFATREVTVDDRTWRPIVAIDCRPGRS